MYLQIVEETIPELVKLKKEGLIRHIGITGLPLPIYKKVLDRCPPFLVHLCIYCLQCFNPPPPPDPLPPWQCDPFNHNYLLRLMSLTEWHCWFCVLQKICCQTFGSRLPRTEIKDPCCVARRLPNGTVDVILAYCHNSINDDSLQGLVPYLKEQGVGIISASPMSMGLLTTKVGSLFTRKRL